MTAPHTLRYGSVEVARAAGISLRQLYYWVQTLHLVRPQKRRHGRRMFCHFTAHDVEQLKAVKRLLQRGYTLQAAVRRAKGSA